MPGYVNILISYHKKNKLRAQNFFFMKACMAAAAAVAIADGEACRKEVTATKAMLEILDELKLFDPQHGVEIYADYVARIERDPERGRKDVMQALLPIRQDAELMQLLVMICHTVSEADGIVREEEVEMIDDICQYLDIDPKAVRAVDIDLREHLSV